MTVHRFDLDRETEPVKFKCDKCGKYLEVDEEPHALVAFKFIGEDVDASYIPRHFYLCDKCYNEFYVQKNVSAEIIVGD